MAHPIRFVCRPSTSEHTNENKFRDIEHSSTVKSLIISEATIQLDVESGTPTETLQSSASVPTPTIRQDILAPGVSMESKYINEGKGKSVSNGNIPDSPAPFNDMSPCTHRKMLFSRFNDSVLSAMSSKFHKRIEEHAWMREKEVKPCLLVYHYSSGYPFMPLPLTICSIFQTDHSIHVSCRGWRGKLNHVRKQNHFLRSCLDFRDLIEDHMTSISPVPASNPSHPPRLDSDSPAFRRMKRWLFKALEDNSGGTSSHHVSSSPIKHHVRKRTWKDRDKKKSFSNPHMHTRHISGLESHLLKPRKGKFETLPPDGHDPGSHSS